MATDAQLALANAKASLEPVAAAVGELIATNGQLSLQVDSLSEANVELQAQNDALRAENAELKKKLEPTTPPPAPLTWKQKWGVAGDGIKDDTVAIQKAIDAGDGNVPAGCYLINSLRVASGTSFYGLLVGAGKRLECDPDAIFVVKPNAAPKNMCIRVDSGVMVGGQVLGDRDQHTYSGTTTHEWGYGVQLRGTNPQTIGVKVSKCTGDGFGVSGTNPVMRDCVSDGNRRQGLSVFTCTGLRAYNCQFNNTQGTAPEAGVDLEPDEGGYVKDAVFENCSANGNRTSGFMGEVRKEVAGNVEMTLKNCNTNGNANGIRGAGYNGKTYIRVEGGSHVNKSACVRAETGSVITVVGGTMDITDKSLSTAQQYAIQKYGTGVVNQSGVTFK